MPLATPRERAWFGAVRAARRVRAEDRVRDFSEVVRRKKITVEQLVAGGWTPRAAEGIVHRAKAAAAAAVPVGK
jgi:hypothetical protein